MTISQLLRAWILLTAMLATACAPAVTGDALDDIELASALRPFDGCDALATHLRGEASRLVTPYGLQGAFPSVAVTEDRAVAEASGAAPGSGADGAAPFSTTNVQEVGVDEADIVKTDGAHVYAMTDGVLRIVDVREPRPQLVATLRLADGWPRDMLLHGDRLLVLGDGGRLASARPESLPRPGRDGVELLPPGNGQTQLWLVDVANPSAPVVQSTMVVDGSLLTSRLTGPTARVVVRSGPWLAGLVAPTGGPGAEARALAINRAHVAQADARDWLPQMSVDGSSPQPLVDCAAVHSPPTTPDLSMVSVLSLDLTDAALGADRENTKAVLGAADTVYANTDSLYVTTGRWPALPVEPVPLPLPVEPGVSDTGPPMIPELPERELPEPELPEPDVSDRDLPVAADMPDSESSGPQRLVTDVPTTDLPVRSDAPASEISPPQVRAPTVSTEVHRFALDDAGASYAASGSVPGTVLNQWALSEHEGHLRIATTEDATDGSASLTSAVRVLEQRGSRLEQVGHVGDLGRGERIFAVRYAGDVGYVVTFRQIDPLYTLDLSDPTDPRVLGELKIPGYSAYLHPIGDDHLLGVGQDADRDGRVRGVQISLFDIADLSAPDRVAQVRLGPDTSSDVEHDHRALLYWPDRDLVVLPVQRWSTGDGGALVLTADADGGLSQRGFVRQPSSDQQPALIQRSLIVGDRLVTVGPSGVMISELDSLSALGMVQFDPSEG